MLAASGQASNLSTEAPVAAYNSTHNVYYVKPDVYDNELAAITPQTSSFRPAVTRSSLGHQPCSNLKPDEWNR